MMTLSPSSTCGVKEGLCLPRKRIATIVARRPTTRPLASIRSHFFSTSAGLVEVVLPNMRVLKSVIERARREDAPKRGAYKGAPGAASIAILREIAAPTRREASKSKPIGDGVSYYRTLI